VPKKEKEKKEGKKEGRKEGRKQGRKEGPPFISSIHVEKQALLGLAWEL
jgi:flagellar biosynthesis/type III secretory pathway protein FliH